MKLILKETIEHLGVIGSEVDVAKGYARNYLMPQGKAVEATPQNRKMMEQAKKKFELQRAKEKEHAREMASRIEGLVVTVPVKVSEENRLYGSIQVRDIAQALKAMDVEIEKRMILLSEPIKELGTFQVPIRVYAEVEPEITVEVVAEE